MVDLSYWSYLTDPVWPGLFYKQLCHWLINSLSHSWFVKISLRRRHAPVVGNGAFSHKIDYIAGYWFSDLAEWVDFSY